MAPDETFAGQQVMHLISSSTLTCCEGVTFGVKLYIKSFLALLAWSIILPRLADPPSLPSVSKHWPPS